MINSARFINSDHTVVEITSTVGRKISFFYKDDYECQFTEILGDWLEDGGSIDDYDPNYGKTDNQIKKEKRDKINKARNDNFKDLQVEYVAEDTNSYTIDAHEKARQEFNGVVSNIILSRMLGSSHVFVYNNMEVVPTKQERIVIYLN